MVPISAITSVFKGEPGRSGEFGKDGQGENQKFGVKKVIYILPTICRKYWKALPSSKTDLCAFSLGRKEVIYKAEYTTTSSWGKNWVDVVHIRLRCAGIYSTGKV